MDAAAARYAFNKCLVRKHCCELVCQGKRRLRKNIQKPSKNKKGEKINISNDL